MRGAAAPHGAQRGGPLLSARQAIRAVFVGVTVCGVLLALFVFAAGSGILRQQEPAGYCGRPLPPEPRAQRDLPREVLPPGMVFSPFPSFFPHPRFWVAMQARTARPTGWHWNRENLTYALMREILGTTPSPVMVDVGANHGFFALYALAAGAVRAVALEPQRRLVAAIEASAAGNGWAGRLKVLHQAVSLQPTRVSMRRTRGDGGTAYAARVGSREAAPEFAAYPPRADKRTVAKRVATPAEEPEAESVEALPLSPVLSETGEVTFLKIDVEGYEVAALLSALPDFQRRRLAHVVVEFGPPRRVRIDPSQLPGLRQGVSQESSALRLGASVRTLRAIAAAGYHLYIIPGWCWADYEALGVLESGLAAAVGCVHLPVMPVPSNKLDWLISVMKHECMLWWTRDPVKLEALPPDWSKAATAPPSWVRPSWR
eukprot:TRINITY_DN25857_c0_g1_i1.p1 TRINITY_DN25857_c0_g1~~TRINITY_DN25857_c0_g1_i1.p1  ORF type:complete len:460 (+),score=78.60 TRINITY_DN25857_c0_g1_i1:93-1382(+)